MSTIKTTDLKHYYGQPIALTYLKLIFQLN